MKAYVAIEKSTGKVMHGGRGQTVWGNAGNLRKSIGQDYLRQHEAKKHGVAVKDLYDVYEFELNLEEGVKL